MHVIYSRMRVQGHAGSEPLPPIIGSEFLRQMPCLDQTLS